MKVDLVLEKEIKEISELLEKSYPKIHDIGILSGLSGIALFQFYCGQYFSSSKISNRGIEVVSAVFERLNSGYSNPNYSSGIAGATWTLAHLAEGGFLDLELDLILPDIDSFLFRHQLRYIESKNFDFLHGAIGIGFYFLKRFRTTQNIGLKAAYKSKLIPLIDALVHHAITDENGTRWVTQVNNEDPVEVYDFGLAHGIAGIIVFLSKVAECGIKYNVCRELVRGSIKYILLNKKEDNNSLFPIWIVLSGIPSPKSRLAWCYGDLCIAHALFNASRIFSNPNWHEISLDVFEYCSKKRSAEDTMVIDASICHGAFGISHIYQRLYADCGKQKFNETATFWMNFGLSMNDNEEGHITYKQWQPATNGWRAEISLLEGIAGIGLCMIDQLKKGENKWDECLMIR